MRRVDADPAVVAEAMQLAVVALAVVVAAVCVRAALANTGAGAGCWGELCPPAAHRDGGVAVRVLNQLGP